MFAHVGSTVRSAIPVLSRPAAAVFPHFRTRVVQQSVNCALYVRWLAPDGGGRRRGSAGRVFLTQHSGFGLRPPSPDSRTSACFCIGLIRASSSLSAVSLRRVVACLVHSNIARAFFLGRAIRFRQRPDRAPCAEAALASGGAARQPDLQSLRARGAGHRAVDDGQRFRSSLRANSTSARPACVPPRPLVRAQLRSAAAARDSQFGCPLPGASACLQRAGLSVPAVAASR